MSTKESKQRLVHVRGGIADGRENAWVDLDKDQLDYVGNWSEYCDTKYGFASGDIYRARTIHRYKKHGTAEDGMDIFVPFKTFVEREEIDPDVPKKAERPSAKKVRKRRSPPSEPE